MIKIFQPALGSIVNFSILEKGEAFLLGGALFIKNSDEHAFSFKEFQYVRISDTVVTHVDIYVHIKHKI